MPFQTNILIADAFLDFWPGFLLDNLDAEHRRSLSMVQAPGIETLHAYAERGAPDLIRVTLNNVFLDRRRTRPRRAGGLWACELLRDLKRRYRSPVFAFAGWRPGRNRRLARIAGVDFFSARPFDPPALRAAVDHHVNHAPR